MNAAIVWTLLCIAADVQIDDTAHIAGKVNVTCDALSRRTPCSPRLSHKEVTDLGLANVNILDLEREPAVMTMIRCCDPTRVLETDAQFGAFWAEARASVDGILKG